MLFSSLFLLCLSSRHLYTSRSILEALFLLSLAMIVDFFCSSYNRLHRRQPFFDVKTFIAVVAASMVVVVASSLHRVICSTVAERVNSFDSTIWSWIRQLIRHRPSKQCLFVNAGCYMGSYTADVDLRLGCPQNEYLWCSFTGPESGGWIS